MRTWHACAVGLIGKRLEPETLCSVQSGKRILSSETLDRVTPRQLKFVTALSLKHGRTLRRAVHDSIVTLYVPRQLPGDRSTTHEVANENVQSPSRPRCRWIDQIRMYNNDTPPGKMLSDVMVIEE